MHARWADPRLTAGCSCARVQASHKGLTADEAKKRLEEYGPNKLPEEVRNPILVYLG